MLCKVNQSVYWSRKSQNTKSKLYQVVAWTSPRQEKRNGTRGIQTKIVRFGQFPLKSLQHHLHQQVNRLAYSLLCGYPINLYIHIHQSQLRRRISWKSVSTIQKESSRTDFFSNKKHSLETYCPLQDQNSESRISHVLNVKDGLSKTAQPIVRF